MLKTKFTKSVNQYVRITLELYVSIHMLMYCHLPYIFTDGLEVEVIPSACLTDNKKKAYWPMWRNMTKVQSAIKQCLKPGADYLCLDIRELYESGKIHVNGLLWMFNISYQMFKFFEFLE